jgi:hypothetical protein
MARIRKGEVKKAIVEILSEAYPEAVRFHLLKQKQGRIRKPEEVGDGWAGGEDEGWVEGGQVLL